MHIKIINGIPENYSVDQLLQDSPQTSFPQPIPNHVLAEHGVFPLAVTEPPEYNQDTHNIVLGIPSFDGTVWHQTWLVTEASPEEIAERAAAKPAAIEAMRRNAYQAEADPIFFKWQRGEATQGQWLAKVQEIKLRY